MMKKLTEKYLFLLLFIILSQLIVGCRNFNRKFHIIPSMYYWKNNLKFDNYEKNTTKELGISKIYIKLFDIGYDKNKGAYPLSQIKIFSDTIFDNLEITPVIFIKNDVFKNLSMDEIEILTQKIQNKIQFFLPNLNFKEIQFDCDWTKNTKDAYFHFLKTYKNKSPQILISATIRLHQIKYRNNTGIPPVDRGMLMIYNLNDPTKFDVRNSILDLNEVKKYLNHQDIYPLPLAHSIFSL